MILYNEEGSLITGSGAEIVNDFLVGTMTVLGDKEICPLILEVIEYHESLEGHKNEFLKDFAKVIEKHKDYLREFAENHARRVNAGEEE